MTLLSMEAVAAIDDPERKHLKVLDDAILGCMLASGIAASAEKIDGDLIGRASVTLLLVAAAREAVKCCDRSSNKFNVELFCELAGEIGEWIKARSARGPVIMN